MSTREKIDKRMRALRFKEFLTGASVDWEIFKNDGDDQPSIYDEISTYLDVDYKREERVVFKTGAWRELFTINEPLYRELIMEFYATYSFKASSGIFTDPNVIKFRLGGKNRHLSIVQLARILGLYPPEITRHLQFATYLRTSVNEAPDERLLLDFWSRIGYSEYNEKMSSTTSIRDPLLRLFHHLLIKTVTSRKGTSNKVTKKDLFLLFCIANRIHVNVPYIIAKYFAEMNRNRANYPITGGGQYITRIARYFGLLTEVNLRDLTRIDSMPTLGKDYWVLYGICKARFNEHVNLVWETRHDWESLELGNHELEQDSEPMEEEGLDEYFEMESESMEQGNTGSFVQLLTGFDANLGSIEVTGGANVNQEPNTDATIPDTSMDQWFPNWATGLPEQAATTSNVIMEQTVAMLEAEVQQLKAQLNKVGSIQVKDGWDIESHKAWIVDHGQKLETINRQMEWIRRRVERIYPPGDYPGDPWPQPPPPPL